MKLTEFTIELGVQLDEFKAWYINNHNIHGDNIYPLDLNNSEWLEQFIIYLQLEE